MISIYQVWFPMIYHMLCRIDAGGASAPKSHVGTWQKRLRSFFTLPLASTSWNFMKLQYLLHTSRIHTTAIYGDLYLHLLGALDNTYRNIIYIYIYIIYINIYIWQQAHSHFSASLPSLCPSFQCCRESGISPRCLKRNLIRKYLYFILLWYPEAVAKRCKKCAPNIHKHPKSGTLIPKFWVTWINLVTFWSCLTHWPVRRSCSNGNWASLSELVLWLGIPTPGGKLSFVASQRVWVLWVVCYRMTVCLKHLTLGKLLCKKHTHYHSLPAQWNAHIFTTMCILPWADLCNDANVGHDDTVFYTFLIHSYKM